MLVCHLEEEYSIIDVALKYSLKDFCWLGYVKNSQNLCFYTVNCPNDFLFCFLSTLVVFWDDSLDVLDSSSSPYGFLTFFLRLYSLMR